MPARGDARREGGPSLFCGCKLLDSLLILPSQFLPTPSSRYHPCHILPLLSFPLSCTSYFFSSPSKLHLLPSLTPLIPAPPSLSFIPHPSSTFFPFQILYLSYSHLFPLLLVPSYLHPFSLLDTFTIFPFPILQTPLLPLSKSPRHLHSISLF